jgi:hypothetical protein
VHLVGQIDHDAHGQRAALTQGGGQDHRITEGAIGQEYGRCAGRLGAPAIGFELGQRRGLQKPSLHGVEI